jgi:hypothetical protein
MQSNKFIISLIIFFSISFSFSQLKGKAKHLPGTWVYQEGSGYEVWQLENEGLTGTGYRMNKIGDTIRVEALGIRLVNSSLFYTLETGTHISGIQTTYAKRQFVSKRRKLDFTNIEDSMPVRLKYAFGFFNKKKLIITVYMTENVKKTKLILRKKI